MHSRSTLLLLLLLLPPPSTRSLSPLLLLPSQTPSQSPCMLLLLQPLLGRRWEVVTPSQRPSALLLLQPPRWEVVLVLVALPMSPPTSLARGPRGPTACHAARGM